MAFPTINEIGMNNLGLEGNEESPFSLQSNEEYESLVSSYKGEEPEWFDCESFADIPQNQEITEAKIVEKNAKNRKRTGRRLYEP